MNPQILEATQKRFIGISLDEKVLPNLLKNEILTKSLIDVIDKSGLSTCDKIKGQLLYKVATECHDSLQRFRGLLAKFIAQGKIDRALQVDIGIFFLRNLALDQEVDVGVFSKYIGVGVVLQPQEVRQAVQQVCVKLEKELKILRYAHNRTDFLNEVKKIYPYVDGAMLMKEYNDEILHVLGPKTKEDDELIKEVAKKKGSNKIPDHEKRKESATQEDQPSSQIDDLLAAPKVKLTEIMGRDLVLAKNTKEELEWKKAHFGETILTRFPPEPNGYLHIGHCKAMRFSFTVANEYEGQTYLRFDDTNPDAETKEYIDNVKENVKFMGHDPWKITFASDHFEFIYESAVNLIKSGKAYVCEQTADQMHRSRELGDPSPYRNRPIEENLRMFENMRRGFYEEGKVCLRAKIDYAHPNTTLRDPVMYRIKYTAHPHTGNKWCIYPIYDFTHCICDSREGITHSLCTLEFEIRRELYYWYLENTHLYKPSVWEYSRLNITHTVLSKRKVQQLVFDRYVNGWDDPRILTINGMRRRGYTAQGINDFCSAISVTRRGNENFIDLHVLEHWIREDLDQVAHRTLAILDPVPLVLENINEPTFQQFQAPLFPSDQTKGTYEVTLSRHLFVDRDDVSLEDHKDFYGIAPNQLIGLKYAAPVQITKILTDKDNRVTEVRGEFLETSTEKPQGFLHWISREEAHECEVRLYDLLFKEPDTSKLKDDWLDHVNQDSVQIFKNSLMNQMLLGKEHLYQVQFERLGFFAVDFDSKVQSGQYVWNRTLGLIDKERQKVLGKMVSSKQ